jgi:hypothetical protein
MLATELASINAVLTTFVGSIIPFSIIFTYTPLEASKPWFKSVDDCIFSTTENPLNPAF